MMRDVNIHLPDRHSDITGHGRHNRLLVFLDRDGQTVTIREDLSGLPLSTPEDRRKVTRGWQRMHPRGSRLVFVATSDRYWSGDRSWESIDHTYRIVRRGE